MKELFIPWNPNRASLLLLAHITTVLEDLSSQGYRLTLRQLYYQLVAKGIIPNNDKEYTKIGNIVNKGRLSGLIDWRHIEDRLRQSVRNPNWTSPKSILESAAAQYNRNKWVGQEYYVEIWCEKDAVSNILQPICTELDVTFMANRGYSSQSAMYAGAGRIDGRCTNKKAIVIYFGDHDPSGLDMVRDVEDRLNLFMMNSIKVEHIALTMEQIEEFNPPPNPAKLTDTRAFDYIQRYGNSSWELDAIEPRKLAKLAKEAILQYLDMSKFKTIQVLEEEEKSEIRELADNWED